MKLVTLEEIRAAAERIKGVAYRTAFEQSRSFSVLTGAEVFLKLENRQKTGSFKLRGAYNKIATLTEAERACGVVASSAGNHAQGVAYGATAAGIKATIVMPTTAPLAKVEATKGYGAQVVQFGTVYDDAYGKAREICEQQGAVFIHPFNDRDVIAGQGTIGLEILQDMPDIDAIVVPIGGGGLLSGIATAVKELNPQVKVYGVQAEGAPAMYRSVREGRLMTTDTATTIADGIAVKIPGDFCYKHIEHYVDDVFVVNDDKIAATIFMLMERSRIISEGAGATALAAVLNGIIPKHKKIVSIVSGGNIDINLISRIIDRGLIRSGRMVRIAMTAQDRPGILRDCLSIIATTGANITSISQDRLERDLPLGFVLVEVAVETRNRDNIDEVLAKLHASGFDARIDDHIH